MNTLFQLNTPTPLLLCFDPKVNKNIGHLRDCKGELFATSKVGKLLFVLEVHCYYDVFFQHFGSALLKKSFLFLTFEQWFSYNT